LIGAIVLIAPAVASVLRRRCAGLAAVGGG